MSKGVYKHTVYPSVTGSSVIGVMYNEGVIIAADTKGSYGSFNRYTQIDRVFKATDLVAVGCGGDIADYQFIRDVIEQKVRDDECEGHSRKLDAGSLHCWLARVLYNRRTKFDPLWLDCIVGGFSNGKPYLGYVDKIGTAFNVEEFATGLGQHMALPMLRKAKEGKETFTRQDAKEVIKEAMKLLYYRDNTGHYEYQIADINSTGVDIEKINFKRETNWDVANITYQLIV